METRVGSKRAEGRSRAPLPARLPRARAQGSARPAGPLIRPIFNADNLAEARDRLSEAVAHLDGRLAKLATLLEDAEADIPASTRARARTVASCARRTGSSATTGRSAAAPTSFCITQTRDQEEVAQLQTA